MRKWSWMLVLVLIIGVFATGCGTKGETDEVTVDDTSLTDIQAKGTLVVGCDDEFPPMGFRDENGEVTGFDIELAKLVAEKLGVEAVVQPIDWKTKEMSLESKKIDVIWNGYTIDKERNGKVEYTKPYLNNQQVIVVKADSEINAKADLADKVVGAQANSSGLKAIKSDEAFKDSLAELKEYDTYPQALLDLEGRIDAVVIDKILIGYVMAQEPDTYRILDETMGDEFYGIGCRKGGVALRVAIDDALDELMEDGSIEALSTEWFGSNIVIRDVEKLTDEDLAE
ncbi:amino acid ABC transporter substrate-binding protein [Anaerovorax sp. IOR16]|uniref:amino acid ABC transporter substrate-binding protein n=1 Tax=Anaerovorax sp. IOR16 TaxID=2773458 RepID=UPI0019D2E23B|nr:amino acid ABC transporter substrate-binding protein [Anaerovorax sp. IOR16]